MAPTLRRILEDRSLQLRMLTAETELPAGALDAPVSWVHSTEMADPTPFMSGHELLLTTGTQWPDDDPEGYARYVARLAEAEVAAIGFGTEISKIGTPPALVDACRDAGLPLFEVPYDTPFIAVTKRAADLIALESYARATWTLESCRSIALAALRPDGLSAALAELATQTGRCVAFYDSTGELARHYPQDAIDQEVLDASRVEAGRLLGGARRSSASITLGDTRMWLQTLGNNGRIRGVLAIVGGDELDQADRSVVTMVIAMAGLALEHDRELDDAKLHLREGLFVALLGGQFELVDQISHTIWGPLPRGPLDVTVLDADPELVRASFEHFERASGTCFFAVHDKLLILVTVRGSCLSAIWQGAAAGTAHVADWNLLPRGVDNATRALERARSLGGLVDFDEVANEGVLAWISARADPAIAEVGRGILRTLLDHDARNQGDLIATLRVWLAHDTRLDAAAAELGVHRHTARARIERAGRLLGRDLSGFADRAEVWAALVALDAGDRRQYT